MGGGAECIWFERNNLKISKGLKVNAPAPDETRDWSLGEIRTRCADVNIN